MNKQIYVLEDDENINEIIRFNLEKNGFAVKSFFNGTDFYRAFNFQKPDLVILDLMLPDADGYEVCKLIKTESDVAVLILSTKSEELDKVLGLELGADDYMVKPFGIRELLARIKNILKKSEMISQSSSKKSIQSSYLFGNIALSIDENGHIIFLNNVKVDLNPKEFQILLMLLKNINNLTPRHELIKQIWGNNYFGDTRTLDVHIRRIREKMSLGNFGSDYLKTVHGLGYKLVEKI